jgi:hypothetical protein
VLGIPHCTNLFIEKYLLALRCLLQTLSISPSDPTGHQQLIRLQHTLTHHASDIVPKVSELIKAELEPIFPSPNPDLKKFNDEWLEKHKLSTEHVLAGLQARQHLNKATKEANENEILHLLGVGRQDTTLANTEMAVDVVKGWHGDVGRVLEAARAQWPEATAFQAAV